MEIQIKFNEFKNFEIDFEKIDELWAKDVHKATIEIMKDLKHHKADEIEGYAAENGELREYLYKRIFPSVGDGFFIVEHGEISLKLKSWEKYKTKINCKSKKLYKVVVEDCKRLYKPQVNSDEYLVNSAKKQLNLAQPMNFTYDKTKPMDEKNGKRILEFIKEVLTSNNEEEWTCLKYIIGCMCNRQRSDLILFLQGLGGIGKSFFASILQRLLGKSSTGVTEDIVSGDSQFNKCMIGAVCAFLEETSGMLNYLKLIQGLKSLSTAEELTARMMYSEGFAVRNVINFVVLSNYFKDLDCSDRRMFLPTLNNKYQNNQAYFADLALCLTDEALQYVFNFFYEVDVSKKMKAPLTQTKQDYKLTNMNSCLQFVIQKYMVEERLENNEQKLGDVFKKYEIWASKNNIKYVAKDDFFKNTMRQYTYLVQHDGKPKMKDHTQLYDFSTPALIDKIITRSEVLTMQQYEEKLHEFANKDYEIFEDDKDKLALNEKIKLLQNLLKEQEKKNEELTELLAKQNKKSEQFEKELQAVDEFDAIFADDPEIVRKQKKLKTRQLNERRAEELRRFFN